MKSYLYIILLCFISSCSTSKVLKTPSNALVKVPSGSSGMAQVDDHSFLAVYDLKNFQEGFRLGLIKSYLDSIIVSPVDVKDWVSDEGIPSDLESITSIPGRNQEYLICESGNWQGNLGRIFHIKLSESKKSSTVLGVIKLPMNFKNDMGLTGDQYEGIACLDGKDGKHQIILAERGGSSVYPNGRLKWAEIDLETLTLVFSELGEKGIQINAPGQWNTNHTKRDITDLYIDPDGELWASASQDLRDSGPFNSIIYNLGNTTANGGKPFTVYDHLIVYKALPGYKIEALSGPSSAAPESNFSFGTEDEIYGGTWRPIE